MYDYLRIPAVLLVPRLITPAVLYYQESERVQGQSGIKFTAVPYQYEVELDIDLSTLRRLCQTTERNRMCMLIVCVRSWRPQAHTSSAPSTRTCLACLDWSGHFPMLYPMGVYLCATGVGRSVPLTTHHTHDHMPVHSFKPDALRG